MRRRVCTLRGKINEPNEQFRNFLLPLLGDKDQEKVLEVVAKVDKNNRCRQTRQNPGGERKAVFLLICIPVNMTVFLPLSLRRHLMAI